MNKDKLNLTPMQEGELQVRAAFEEVARTNIKTIAEYTTKTRKLFNELNSQVDELKDMLSTREIELQELRRQLSLVQAALYKGGTV